MGCMDRQDTVSGEKVTDVVFLQVKVLRDRLPVLDEIDKALAEIFKFNQV